jgi:hypothetical protein
MANYSQNFTIAGLETLTFVVPLAGAYTLSGKLQLPSAAQDDPTDPNYLGYPSAVVTTVKQNGTTIFTSLAGAEGFSIPVLAALSDTFTIALTSSATPDQGLNALRASISIG